MDSLNLSGAQNTRVDSRNTGSNTIPLACASCGSKDYVQSFSNPGSFRAFYSDMPNSKQPSENCEENFTIHQPIFSSPPLIQPFFNSPVLPNFYFPQNNFGAFSNFGRLSEDSKQGKNENEKLFRQNSPLGGFLFCPLDKMQPKNIDPNPSCTEFQKNQNKTENAPQFHTHQNAIESQTNLYSHKCGCDCAIPWTCSPFIVPIISYYVLWNSQRTNVNQSSSSPCNQTKSCSQKENEEKTADFCPHIQNDIDSNVSPIYMENEETEYKKEQDDYWVEDKLTKNEWPANQSCSSFISLNSSNCVEDNFYNADKKNKTNVLIKVHSEERNMEKSIPKKIDSLETNYDEETEEVDLDGSCDTNPLAGEEEKDGDTKVFLENELHTAEIKNNYNEIQPEDLLSTQDLQETGFADDLSSSETQSQLLDIPSEGTNIYSSMLSSDEQLKEKESKETLKRKTTESGNPIVKSRMLKKMIKNFTMTNQNYELSEQSATKSSAGPGAAAGDLGGVNCISYKVKISIPDSNSKDKEGNEIPAGENQDPQELLDMCEKLKEANSTTTIQISNQNSNSTSKCSRNFKSGIAKLSNLKAKDQAADVMPNPKSKTSELQNKQQTVIKYKHNCLVNNKTGNKENNLKISKTKNCTLTEEQTGVSGSDKQKLKRKPTNVKTSTLKKEDKTCETLTHHGSIVKTVKIVDKK